MLVDRHIPTIILALNRAQKVDGKFSQPYSQHPVRVRVRSRPYHACLKTSQGLFDVFFKILSARIFPETGSV